MRNVEIEITFCCTVLGPMTIKRSAFQTCGTFQIFLLSIIKHFLMNTCISYRVFHFSLRPSASSSLLASLTFAHSLVTELSLAGHITSLEALSLCFPENNSKIYNVF